MQSTFGGLEIGLRALRSQQQAIDVVNHNVANANTEGYSRQRVNLEPSAAYTLPSFGKNTTPGQIGTGVQVQSVERMRDAFLDLQIRGQTQLLSQATTMSDTLEQVESVLNEPSDTSLSGVMTQFWQVWGELSNSPNDAGARSLVRETADALATTIRRNYDQLNGIKTNLDTQVGITVAQVNNLGQQVADLNRQISQIETLGDKANDLRDRRDLLLDQLASLVTYTSSEDANGMVSISLGNRDLVSGITTNSIGALVNASGVNDVVWASDHAAVATGPGQLGAMIEGRDTTIPSLLTKLDNLAGTLITRVNAVHSTGYGMNNSTGVDFFAGTGASDIDISADVKASLDNIAAASSADSPGDGSKAVAIADIKHEMNFGGTTTIDDYYNSMISQLGVDTKMAKAQVQNQQALVTHLQQRKESVSGVSLDEETVDLVRFQQAYNAAARVVTAIDQMLDKIVNGMGLVGR